MAMTFDLRPAFAALSAFLQENHVPYLSQKKISARTKAAKDYARGKYEAIMPDEKILDFRGSKKRQLDFTEVRRIIYGLPHHMRDFANLKRLNYAFANMVAMPVLKDEVWVEDENGAKQCTVCHVSNFAQDEYRMLLGSTSLDGTEISFTSVPEVVCADHKAVLAYQTLVFLHEFAHSYLSGLGKHDEPGLFQSWKKLPHRGVLSFYAEMYREQIDDGRGAERDCALEERFCEAFAAYVVDLLVSPAGVGSFRSREDLAEEWKFMDNFYYGGAL